MAARAAFGVYGANVPALLRAAVATGWFGIQTWVGGEAVGALMQAAAEAVGMASVSAALAAPAPAVFAGITCAEVMGFVAFWVLQVGVIVRGIESIKWLERLTAPVLIGLVGEQEDATPGPPNPKSQPRPHGRMPHGGGAAGSGALCSTL